MDVQSYEELQLWNYKPPPEIVGAGIVVEQTGLVIFGHPKTFKSLIAQQLVLCIVTGTPWFNFPTTQRRILYIQAEIPKASFRGRLIQMGKNFPAIPHGLALFSTTFITKLDRDAGRSTVLKAVTKFQPHITVFDPMGRFQSSSGEDSVIKVLDLADELKFNHQQTVIIIHHARKPRVNSVGNVLDAGGGELRGPLIEAWADSIIRIQGNIDTDLRSISFELRNAPQLIQPFNIELDRSKLWFSRI